MVQLRFLKMTRNLFTAGMWLLGAWLPAQEWETVQRDPQHTGRSPRYVFDVPPVERWRASIGGSVFGSPIIRADGSIIVSGGTSKQITAWSASGAPLWNYQAAGSVFGSPAAMANNRVLFSDTEGWTYTLNPNGTLASSTRNSTTPKIEQRNMCDMTLRPGGGFGTGDWLSRLVIKNGTTTRTYALPANFYPTAPVTFSVDGSRAYYAMRPNNANSRIDCIDAVAGTQVWTVQHSPATGKQGTLPSAICLDDTNGRLYFVSNYHQNANGTFLYAYSTGGVRDTDFPVNLMAPSYSTPALSPDGSALYLATLDGRVLKHNSATGARVWTYVSGAQAIRGSVVVDWAGKIVFGDSEGVVHCIDDAGTLLWKTQSVDAVLASSPAIASNGDILIATTNGTLLRYGMQPLVIPYLQKNIVLDGVIGANEWKGAWHTEVDASSPRINPGWEHDAGQALTMADCSYKFYVMHNGSKLLVGFDIDDEVVKATQAPVPETPPPANGSAAETLYQVWWDDCTEVFIDPDNDDVN